MKVSVWSFLMMGNYADSTVKDAGNLVCTFVRKLPVLLFFSDKSQITSSHKDAWMHTRSMHSLFAPMHYFVCSIVRNWTWLWVGAGILFQWVFFPGLSVLFSSRGLYVHSAVSSGYPQANQMLFFAEGRYWNCIFTIFEKIMGSKQGLFITWSWIHLVRILTFNYLQGKVDWLLLTQRTDVWDVTLCCGEISTDSTQHKISTLKSKNQSSKFILNVFVIRHKDKKLSWYAEYWLGL